MSFRWWLIIIALGVLVASAAPVPIGVLTTVGAVRVDNSEVRGNGTVVDGALIETSRNPSQLNLKNGTRFELSPNTRAKVYDNRLVLEKGASQVHGTGSYTVLVNAIHVVPAGPSSTVQVFKTGPKSMEVAAVQGLAEVRNANGLLIARITPGSPLDLEQAPEGAAGPSHVSGKVSKTAGHFTLKDSTTNTTVELQGNNLDSAVGHCVAATGSADPSATAAAGATEIIHVSELKQVACGKKGAVAGGAAGAAGGAAAAGAAGGAAAGAGLSAVAIGGIVAGAATGATLGGLAAAGQFSGGKSTTTSGQ